MKKPVIFAIITLAVFAFSFILKFTRTNETNTYQNTEECPPEGNAKSERIGELNKFKNRLEIPTKQQIDTLITLKKILEHGDDKKRWENTKAVSIIGYVYEVKNGGVETCNCKDATTKDTHIEILLDPMQNEKMFRVVAEVTPRMRKLMLAKGIDWSTKTLRDKILGRWVKFDGWLFFDEEHANAAENTAPGRERNWRATAWEIHPITNIEVTVRPR